MINTPTYTLLEGNNIDVLATLASNSVDCIVTDPPYGLNFMGKKWDYDVPTVAQWQACLRVLKPGGHLLAFAGTRTQHRMCCNIEDAGFEIRDMIAWVYGSGFPKSLDISKAIDKAAGATREVVGTRKQNGKHSGGNYSGDFKGDDSGASYKSGDTYYETIPSTLAAQAWMGWGTALKPAFEPITVARKPITGTVANNVLTYGTGGLNIDGCRVPLNGGTKGAFGDKNQKERTKDENIYGKFRERIPADQNTGRFPSNFIHDGSSEVVDNFPETSNIDKRDFKVNTDVNGMFTSHKQGDLTPIYGDSGNAARFFYCAKASPADRDNGLDGFNTQLKAGANFRPNHLEKALEGETGNPFGRWNEIRNHHPTVKPTELMRYLCRLVCPPGGTVLDAWAGSGSTGRGAVLEGFNFIGIEMEAPYIPIATARIQKALAVWKAAPVHNGKKVIPTGYYDSPATPKQDDTQQTLF